MFIQLEPLVTSDLILILSVLLVVLGWWIKVWQDRKFDIFKRRMDKRMESFESVLKILTHTVKTKNLAHPDMKKWLEDSAILFQIYNEKDEIEIYQKFIKSIEEKDLEKTNRYLDALTSTVVKAIRKDLGLSVSTISSDKPDLKDTK